MAFLGDDAAATALKVEQRAVLDGRQLLADPDPVPPLVHRASASLRAALNQSYAQYAAHFSASMQGLQQEPDWQKLDAADQASILTLAGLSAPEPAPAVGTLAALLASLAQCTPQRWGERHDAIAGKLQQARVACARKLEPKVQQVQVPSRMVRTEAELDAWLADVRAAALAKLQMGPVQL